MAIKTAALIILRESRDPAGAATEHIFHQAFITISDDIAFKYDTFANPVSLPSAQQLMTWYAQEVHLGTH